MDLQEDFQDSLLKTDKNSVKIIKLDTLNL
jgi:hypothetical protein